MTNHRQSSTAFVCFLSEENNLAFGVHRPMLPSSTKLVRKLVELTEQYLLIMLCGYCQHSGKCHKKSEAIAQTLVFYTIRAKEKEKENEGLGTRDYYVPALDSPENVTRYYPWEITPGSAVHVIAAGFLQ